MPQVFNYGVPSDTAKLEELTAAHDGDWNAMGFGGCKNENYMRWRLLQRFEQCIERFSGEHVHFIDYINLVRALGGSVANILPQLSNFVDTPVGSAVDF